MSANGLNVELAERVILHVLTYPEQHEQGRYFQDTPCGTTACLAGRTVLLGGSVEQINECIYSVYESDWATTALALLDPNHLRRVAIEDRFFEYADKAIENFCHVFGLDLEALQEKAAANRGELS
jgi:hypothetical protein